MSRAYLMAGAHVSDDGRYRYRLDRQWAATSRQPRTAVFVMLNPSTADADKDDATIRRCVNFADREGCGRLIVVNLFALRSTDPSALRAGWLAGDDVTGPDNHAAILEAIDEAAGTNGLIIAAWGANWPRPNMPPRLNWERNATANGIKPRCFGLTRHGQPLHPVRLPDAQRLQPWTAAGMPEGNYMNDLIFP